MILHYLSTMWTAIVPALGNHLWQSTLFAGIVGLLTLALRKNQASPRYWLWLAASLKFLVPFSLLISLGSLLSSSKTDGSQPGFSSVVVEINQSFSPVQSASIASTTMLSALALWLPVFLLAVWVGGWVSVLTLWWLRQRRVYAAVRESLPIKAGREVALLRQLEQDFGIPEKIAIHISNSRLEPGIVGIVRPVLLLPSGIADCLTDSQLSAILAHELCHVRRRDNLIAALHMLVEALFWFHPLVWWIGMRLLHERERACDEEVLRFGSEPQIYAESILKVCKFYLESPPFCAAGVTGSNLKKRIEAIMRHRIAGKLGLGKKLLLAAMAAVAITGPLVIGILRPESSHAQTPNVNANTATGTYAYISIKPSTFGVPMPPFKILGDPKEMRGISITNENFMATMFTLHRLIQRAFNVQGNQITGGPDWLDTARYDVVAKMDQAQMDIWQKLPVDQRDPVAQHMLQALLIDRFKLALHNETRQVQEYDLVVGGNGLKINEVAAAPQPGDKRIIHSEVKIIGGHLHATGILMGALTGLLAEQIKHPILDKTNLKGFYDIDMNWPPQSQDLTASLSTALSEQLGLELHEQIGPVEMLVVDRAEKPSGN